MSLEGVRAGGNIEIGDVFYYPIRLRAPLRKVFDPLLDELTAVFGGREVQLGQLVEFMHEPTGGYLVVTAPAGFGKTALMAALVKGAPEAFAYHFFSPLYALESVSEDFFLSNVVEQMAQWHGRRNEPPTELPKLKALYHELLGAPVEQSRILVLDGVDEVGSKWNVDLYLGRRLPPRSHVVLTVRDVGQDWMKDYGLPADQTRHISLAGLSREELAAVLRFAGPRAAALATDPELLDEACRVTAYEKDQSVGADPFYARVLAEDVEASRLEAADIGREPPGLAGYLDKWWETLRETAGEGPAGDLFGVLTVALGRLRREELEAICPTLKGGWAGDLFDKEILPRVRRFVLGDDEEGYALVHPRLHAYMRTRIRTLPAYREMLLSFCAEWKSNASRYALAHYAAHLAEYPNDERDRRRLFALVDSREWYEKRTTTDPSGTSYLQDVALAWGIASRANAEALGRSEKAPLLAREVRSALVTASLRSLSRSVPSRLLVALIRSGIWDPAQAIALVRMNPHGGARARSLAALAPYLSEGLLEEAVDLARRIDDATDRGQALVGLAAELPAARAHELLEETVETLRDGDGPIVMRVDVLVRAAALLPYERAQTALADAEAIARASDPEDRAGILLKVAAATDDRRDDLIDEAISNAGFVNDVEAFARLASRLVLLSQERGYRFVDETLEIARGSADPAELVRTLLALLEGLPDDRRSDIVDEALESAASIEDSEARSRLLGAVIDEVSEAADETTVRKAVVSARSIEDVKAKASALARLANLSDGPERDALVAEALRVAYKFDTGAELANVLGKLLGDLPDTHRPAVLEAARKAARGIEQPSARASALIWLALDLDPDEGDSTLHEAFKFAGAMDAIRSVEPDEVEFAEAIAATAPHLAEEHRSRVAVETIAAARTIDRLYDRAHAFAVLVPLLNANERFELAQEACVVARSIAADAERAEVLSELVAYLPDPVRQSVVNEALASARAVVEGQIVLTGQVSEDGVVEADRSTPFAGLRARVLTAVAPSVAQGPWWRRRSRRADSERLLSEAFDSVYEIPLQVEQAEALTALAPRLPEHLIYRVLSDLRSVTHDELRAHAIASLLHLTHEREGTGSTLEHAQAIFGEWLPIEVVSALASSVPEVEPVDSVIEAEPHADDDTNFRIKTSGRSWLTNIYRLAPSPLDAFGTMVLDPPPDDDLRQEVEERVWRDLLSINWFQLDDSKIRDALAAAHDFHTGQHWMSARRALLRRLAELGSIDDAWAEAEATWREDIPVEVIVALAPFANDARRAAIVTSAFERASTNTQDDARVKAMVALVPHLNGSRLAQALDAVEMAARRIVVEAGSPDTVSTLVELLQALPPARRVPLWQKAVQLASSDVRRNFLHHLPPLLSLVEQVDGTEMWSEAVEALLDVRRHWP